MSVSGGDLLELTGLAVMIFHPLGSVFWRTQDLVMVVQIGIFSGLWLSANCPACHCHASTQIISPSGHFVQTLASLEITAQRAAFIYCLTVSVVDTRHGWVHFIPRNHFLSATAINPINHLHRKFNKIDFNLLNLGEN